MTHGPKISINILRNEMSCFADTSSSTTSVILGEIIAGWPKCFFRFFHIMLKPMFWKSPNEFFGQPNNDDDIFDDNNNLMGMQTLGMLHELVKIKEK